MNADAVRSASDWATIIAGGGGSVVLVILMWWIRSVVRVTVSTAADQKEKIAQLTAEVRELSKNLDRSKECLRCAETRADEYQERLITRLEEFINGEKNTHD